MMGPTTLQTGPTAMKPLGAAQQASCCPWAHSADERTIRKTVSHSNEESGERIIEREIVLGTWMHPPPMAPMTLSQQAAAWPWLQVVGGEVVVGTAEAMMAVERMVMMVVNCILKCGLGVDLEGSSEVVWGLGLDCVLDC